MKELIDLVLTFLPGVNSAIKLLQFIPAAADTVKKLVALVNRTVATLKGPKVKLTTVQRAQLDEAIEGMAADPLYSDPQFDTPPVP